MWKIVVISNNKKKLFHILTTVNLLLPTPYTLRSHTHIRHTQSCACKHAACVWVWAETRTHRHVHDHMRRAAQTRVSSRHNVTVENTR